VFSSRTEWSFTPNRLSRAIAQLRARGLNFLDLTESNPTRCGFQYESARICAALSNPESLVYRPDARGLAAAREAVVAYYAEREVLLDPAQIFLTASTSEAYSYVFRLLADAGDVVLVPRPSYPLFDFLARLNDVKLRSYDLIYGDSWTIDRETLAATLTASEASVEYTRAILLVNPNNPTGSFVHADELDFLVELSRRHRIALIADEVFADFAFALEEVSLQSPEQLRQVRSLTATTDVLTFTMSGLSKISGLPQMKLAWIVATGPSVELSRAVERLETIADTYLSVSAPVQHALPELLETRRRLQPQILNRVQGNLRTLDAYLPRGSIGRLHAEGGWYAILQIPQRGRTDEDWAVTLVEQDQVLVHPGHFYDFRTEDHLVLSLLPPPEVFREAVERLVYRLTF
jgi:aspartate/methionine/tyrosine aminotransferase